MRLPPREKLSSIYFPSNLTPTLSSRVRGRNTISILFLQDED